MDKEEVARARLTEMALRAEKQGRVIYTRFLDPQEAQWAALAARSHASIAFYGGWCDAERRVAAFYPTGEPEPADWPITFLHMRWAARYGMLGHRDILGALMGLRIERELLGDILPLEGEAFAAVLRGMAEAIAGQLGMAGRMPLSCEVLPTMPEAATSMPGQELYATVPSLRLDALLAAAYRLSRTDAQALVREGKVRVDHLAELRPDRMLEPGSLISIRGMGRARLIGTGAINRKGRIGVTLERFG